MTLIAAWCVLVLGAASTAVWAFINFNGQYKRSLRYRLAPPTTPDAADGTPHPSVVILAPGRNEADHLPTVLTGLCEQDYRDAQGRPPLVVFIDDQSDDNTPAIVADFAKRHSNLLAVRNDTPPPAGWVGKCWAIEQGIRAVAANDTAPSDFYCFTDADIHWHPALLRTALSHLRVSGGDVLAVTPSLVFGSRIEGIVQMQLVLALGLMLPFERAMDPAYPDVALCGGAFILVKRDWYDRVGGHTSVKDKVVEDLSLGLELKRAGALMRVAMAGGLQWCRMYEGWWDMWEGLTKNAYAGLEYSPLRAVALVLATVLLNVLPPVYAIVSAVWLVMSFNMLALASLALAVLGTLLGARALNTTRKLLSLPWWYSFTMPIGAGVYAVFVLASMWQFYSGGNTWKGRRYAATGA